jgi:endonuclease-3
MDKAEKVKEIRKVFDVIYEDAICSLTHKSALQLLISTQLAAQCTDARVNIVTVDLYQKYKTVEDFANADLQELEEAIRPTGFYHNKAKNIIACCKKLISDFGGEVPETMEELTSLPGVGRKTANIIIGDIYHKPAVVVDTHCIRLSNRIGLTTQKDPYKIEMDLAKIIEPSYQSTFCHQIVFHGRAFCNARSPKCGACPIAHLCDYTDKKIN